MRAVTDCGIFLGRILAFYCFKCYLGSFSRCKTAFSPTIILPKHAETTKCGREMAGKKCLFSDVRVEEQVEA